MFPETDEEGFLTQPDTWTRGVAEIMAQGVVTGKLEEDHWTVLDCLRDYCLQFETVPPLRILCQRTGIKASHLQKLFPSGHIKELCRIAGIPRVVLRIYWA